MDDLTFEFDHFGIAVNSLDNLSNKFKEIFDINFYQPQYIKDSGVEVSFSKGRCEIEILEGKTTHSPLIPILKNPITEFVKKNNSGVQHICFRTNNIEKAFNFFLKRKIKLLNKKIIFGYSGHKALFINPVEFDGLLIEIIEKNE